MDNMKAIPTEASKEERLTIIPKGSRGKRLEARGILTDFDYVEGRLQDHEMICSAQKCAVVERQA